LHRLDDFGPAPALVAHLHLSLVLAGGGDKPFALASVVRAGLLDINMLAGSAGENRGRRVPVVAGGHDKDVHALIVENMTKILRLLGRLARDLFDSAGGSAGAFAIDVANIADRDSGNLGEASGMFGAAAAGPHYTDNKHLIRGRLVGAR